MAKLEEEVTEFFKMWPSSVFISELPSSFDRLLMHALCQYLDLKSKSKLPSVHLVAVKVLITINS